MSTCYKFTFKKGQQIPDGRGSEVALETFIKSFATSGIRCESPRNVESNRVILIRCSAEQDVMAFKLRCVGLGCFYEEVSC